MQNQNLDKVPESPEMVRLRSRLAGFERSINAIVPSESQMELLCLVALIHSHLRKGDVVVAELQDNLKYRYPKSYDETKFTFAFDWYRRVLIEVMNGSSDSAPSSQAA
jgi:hypothetical protein